MSKFEVKDTVKYTGETFPNLTNREGTILSIDCHIAEVKFQLSPHKYCSRHIDFSNLELVLSHGCKLPSKLDTTNPPQGETVIKDSGDRTEYPSGAVRDKRSGKGVYSLIPSHSLERIAKHYEAGRAKYSDANNPKMGEENWKKGMFLIDFYDSTSRHIEKWKMGLYDEDHLAAACWNLLNLMETERRIKMGIYTKELDNRDPLEFEVPRDIYDKTPHELKIVTGEIMKVLDNG